MNYRGGNLLSLESYGMQISSFLVCIWGGGFKFNKFRVKWSSLGKKKGFTVCHHLIGHNLLQSCQLLKG